MLIKFCSNCGYNFNTSDLYCPRCGKMRQYLTYDTKDFNKKIKHDEWEKCTECEGTGKMTDVGYALFTLVTLGLGPLYNEGNDCLVCKGKGVVKKKKN